MEKKNRYIVLDKEKMFYKDGQTLGCFWFLIDGKEYMFKSYDDLTCYKELFYEIVARILEFPTVHYEFASYNGITGVLIETFNPKKMKEVYLEDVLYKFFIEVISFQAEDFPNEKFLQNTNNLEDIWMAFEYYYKDRKDKSSLVSHLMSQIVKSFVLQIITGNVDLHYQNLVLLDGQEPTMAPNFDYGKCGLVDFDISSYTLQVAPLNFSETYNAKFTISKFLNFSSFEYRDFFLQLIYKMPNFDTVISILEHQIGGSVSPGIKRSLYECYAGGKDFLLEFASEILNSNEEKTMKEERK